ncbi:restriction endonuclease subunit S [Aeromonas diversa]|uniref:restriction endonuclease subunit S n=1 Tax=Aeromonas diversa TaxID=502790 RepID=UPI0034635CBC
MAGQMMQNKAGEVATTQTIPAGYKRTEVGVIPEDWTVVPLGDICSFENGDRSSKYPSNEEFTSSGVPFINAGHVNHGIISLNKMDYIPAHVYERLGGGKVKSGDLVYCLRGSLGKFGVVSNDFGIGAIASSLVIVRPKLSKTKTDYISAYFKSDLSKKMVSLWAGGAAQPNLGARELSNFLVPFPPSAEQTEIARVLSDSDSLIAGMEQLIAKKQSIKTATMQQLLTGRTRLPQFALRPDGTPKGYKTSELGQIPEDWITPTLKGITSNIIDYRGRTPRKLGLEWGGGNILALSAGNVKKGFIDYEAECYFGSDELYKKWMTSGDASKGDIVFTMEAPLGNVALIPNEDKYILSQRTILLQLERSKFLPTFIIQVFLSDMFQSYISESATGSTAQGIKRATFEKMFVAVPSCLEEQTAIATILSDMDSELTALEQKLAKARDLKQGMMQQLLTGRIRLPLPQEA